MRCLTIIASLAIASPHVGAFQSSINREHSSFLSLGKIVTTKFQRKARGENNNDNSCRIKSMSTNMSLENELEGEVEQHSYTLKPRNPYDVHVYYDGIEERTEAMELRTKMQDKFKWMRFYSPKDRPIGPHPIPMWEADFGAYDNRRKWGDVRDFIEAEHGNLSVLIHPHSMDGDYADHTKNAWWAGEAINLRIQSWNTNL